MEVDTKTTSKPALRNRCIYLCLSISLMTPILPQVQNLKQRIRNLKVSSKEKKQIMKESKRKEGPK
jgi:hypothetical protein